MSPAKKGKRNGVEARQDSTGRMHFRAPENRKRNPVVPRQDRTGRLHFRASSLSGRPNPLVVYEDRRGRRYFTRTRLKIWLLTWNCGNTYPSDDHLNTLIVDRLCSCPDADRPDLIVIGAQEHERRTPIHRRIPALLAERGFFNYATLGECVVDGISGGKWYKLQIGRNCQALGVLVGQDTRDQRILTRIKATRKHGKGGIGLAVDIRKQENVFRLVFISAHLGSYNMPNDQREQDYQRIVRKIYSKRQDIFSTGMDRYKVFADAVFLMGDLNFRLRQSEGSQVLSADTSRWDISIYISQGRYPELLEHDELKESSLVDGTNSVTFKFPEPAFPPTYKIKEGNANPAADPNRAMKTYFGRKKAREPRKRLRPKSEERTGIDIGWLDRIGWAESCVQLLDPAEVHVREFNGLHEVIMSDHAPVLMKAEVVLYR